ncbi:MAG: hypothetical protein NC930_02135 [Candidatus Omnitrophica bacterium]|nr:hypothetical protein [Candidatus Omnitrophota bacterium]
MPYDSKLDECLFSKSWGTESERLTVGVYSYNKGPKKLQITRENVIGEDGFRFVRLGRLSKEEVNALLPIIQEALSYLN